MIARVRSAQRPILIKNGEEGDGVGSPGDKKKQAGETIEKEVRPYFPESREIGTFKNWERSSNHTWGITAAKGERTKGKLRKRKARDLVSLWGAHQEMRR